jgi:hypothetical protein
LYNGALSSTDINNKVMAGQPLTSGLVARWTLDETGSGLTITADPMKAAIVFLESGLPNSWSPAAGGFYRSIRRE